MAKKEIITTEEAAPVRSGRAAKQEEKKNKKTAKVKAPRKSRIKDTFSELKKVSWPTFGKTMKQTGMVLTVVLIFGLLVFGLDELVTWLVRLIINM